MEPAFIYRNIGFESTRMFFDKAPVLAAVNQARVRVLSKFGAYVRRRARSSIRPGGKSNIISAPGEPPRSHAPEPNVRTIFFFYSPFTKSVIAGPVALNHRPSSSTIPGDITRVLEHGGSLDVIEHKVGSKWAPGRNRRRRLENEHRVRRVHVDARPFMRPALEAEIPGFPDLWADSIRPARLGGSAHEHGAMAFAPGWRTSRGSSKTRRWSPASSGARRSSARFASTVKKAGLELAAAGGAITAPLLVSLNTYRKVGAELDDHGEADRGLGEGPLRTAIRGRSVGDVRWKRSKSV